MSERLGLVGEGFRRGCGIGGEGQGFLGMGWEIRGRSRGQ